MYTNNRKVTVNKFIAAKKLIDFLQAHHDFSM
jgi:hypothetical protein